MTTEGVLLDVSLLIACAWTKHLRHADASRWLVECAHFATCPATQMGFLRVSMSAAHGANYEDARAVLEDIVALPAHRFVTDSISANNLPGEIASRHDITDAHLLAIARYHQLRFATLDEALCRKDWAQEVAFNPLAQSR